MLVLNANPAQVPRGPLIVPWMFEDGRLERRFIAVVAITHRDARPWNIVAWDGLPAGFIDWVTAGRPNR